MMDDAGGCNTIPTEAPLLASDARILAEFLMGRLRFPGDPRSSFVQTRRKEMSAVLAKAVGGKDKLIEVLKGRREAAHVLVDMICDRVAGTDRDETQVQLKELPILLRAQVEAIAAELTGRAAPSRSDRPGRWNNKLWEIKNWVERLASISISDLEPAEIVNAYRPVLHGAVDIIAENIGELV